MNEEQEQKIITYLKEQIIESYVTHRLAVPDDSEIKRQVQGQLLQLSEEDKTELLNQTKS